MMMGRKQSGKDVVICYPGLVLSSGENYSVNEREASGVSEEVKY